MKKTVSINIGGIIFHIEEDGYEKLKNYLDSINKYFSSFEDNKEITADIESRIAEIFLEKLADGRQTVTIDDVNELIATMGTTRDFEASIEMDDTTKQQYTEEPHSTTEAASPEPDKRLYRDTKRGMLGGVAAGVAHYFRIDPLWIRLLFVVFFINVFLEGLSGATLLAYIILWVVLPPNNQLEDDKKVKKLFRNPESRVLGGVAGGIASYFGTDTTVIRLIFVLSIFLGGAGILIYIILWIITPEAKTITEKMQMQGEPVTLSNIEDNVKRSLNVKEGEESPLVKILLFPFRLIALLIRAIGQVLGPLLRFLAELIRIAFGALLVIIGFAFMVSFIAITFGFLGFMGIDGHMYVDDLPLELIRRTLETWPVVSMFLITVIPAIAISLLGLVIITKKRVANAYVGWSLFGLWVLGLIIASFSIPNVVREFTTEEDVRTEKVFALTQATPTFRLNDLGGNSFDLVKLRLRGHEDSTYQLIKTVTSRGRDHDNAEQNANSVIYNVEQKGEDIYFDSRLSFPDDARFRFQHVNLTLFIPYGKNFRLGEDLDEILDNTLYHYGYRSDQLENNEWVIDREGLKCTTCTTQKRYEADDNVARIDRSDYDDKDRIDYPLENFNEVRITALFDVEIRKGDTYSVTLRGDDHDLDEVSINQVGDRLEIRYREDNWKWWKDNGSDKVGVFITMPTIEHLELIGDCDGEVHGFDGGSILVESTGASDLYLNVSPDELELKITGAGTIDLHGATQRLDVDLTGASGLNAFDFRAQTASVNAIGASKAEIYASEEMDLSAAGVSKIRYRGTDNVKANASGISKIERD